MIYKTCLSTIWLCNVILASIFAYIMTRAYLEQGKWCSMWNQVVQELSWSNCKTAFCTLQPIARSTFLKQYYDKKHCASYGSKTSLPDIVVTIMSCKLIFSNKAFCLRIPWRDTKLQLLSCQCACPCHNCILWHCLWKREKMHPLRTMAKPLWNKILLTCAT